jgi:hypothetical protein
MGVYGQRQAESANRNQTEGPGKMSSLVDAPIYNRGRLSQKVRVPGNKVIAKNARVFLMDASHPQAYLHLPSRDLCSSNAGIVIAFASAEGWCSGADKQAERTGG